MPRAGIGCLRCPTGSMFLEEDIYGSRLVCFQCGRQESQLAKGLRRAYEDEMVKPSNSDGCVVGTN